MRVDAANILVLVGRRKWQIFTTFHEMTVYLMILIKCTVLYSCKWYQSTGNIFTNMGVMSKSMDKIVETSGSLTVF